MNQQLRLNKYVTVVVRDISVTAANIKLIELADPDDWELPPFTAGAHIDLVLSDDLIRQYSLCGDPADRHRYRIAVLADRNGRGGSLHIHQHLKVGDRIPVSLPRNLFPLAPKASKHILIAGGIGITPFMAMAPALARRNEPFHLHVCTRTPDHTAFRPVIHRWVEQGRASYHHDHGDVARGLDVAALLARVEPGVHVYCCGPRGLIDAFIAATAHWPGDAVHYERFSGSPALGRAYTLKLAKSGTSIDVRVNETMANALKRRGVDLRTACEAGICGICRIQYVAGDPDHRDHVLSGEERKHCVMPCVSGSIGTTLILDL